jgi:hypothetical protein
MLGVGEDSARLRRTFDSVAECYQEARPEYPTDVELEREPRRTWMPAPRPIDDRSVRGHRSVLEPRRRGRPYGPARRWSLGLRLGLRATLWHVAAKQKTKDLRREVAG